MRRSLSSRVFSLVLSVWLPLFMSGAEWVVHCPTHGGTAVADASSSHTAGHSMAGHEHGVDTSTSSPEGHNCSCPGPGCGTAAVAVVPTLEVPLAHVVAVHEATAVATLARFASASDYLHPPATAPPAVALAL
jgi:hypothetical protein